MAWKHHDAASSAFGECQAVVGKQCVAAQGETGGHGRLTGARWTKESASAAGRKDGARVQTLPPGEVQQERNYLIEEEAMDGFSRGARLRHGFDVGAGAGYYIEGNAFKVDQVFGVTSAQGRPRPPIGQTGPMMPARTGKPLGRPGF
jgi:hypothetical protein